MNKRKSLNLILVGIFSFLLIFIGTKISQLFFLAWIGTWLIVIALIRQFHRWKEEMKKEGKEIMG